jgi:omega-amidase
MKIALGQLKIFWEDKKANMEKLKICLKQLSDVDLFLMPEMSLTGFSMNTEKTKENKKETVCQIRELARQYDIAIGVGWVKDLGTICENHYSIISGFLTFFLYFNL